MGYQMRRKIAGLFSWLLALASVIFPILITTKDNSESSNSKVIKYEPKTHWSKSVSKYYAKALMAAQYEQWDTKSEFRALAKLWGKESAWDHTADNPKSTAYGIPQLLGLKTGTPAPEQIARGLAYIQHRYGKPSVAWAHWRKHGWY